MTQVNEAALIFRNELESMETEEIRNFASNALGLAGEEFAANEADIIHTKKVFRVCDQLLKDTGTAGAFRDGMLTAVLIMDIAKHKMPEGFDKLHPVAIGPMLESVKSCINPEIYKGILSMAEGHEAEHSPTLAMEPKPGSPAYLIALANKIVRMDFVNIEVD